MTNNEEKEPLWSIDEDNYHCCFHDLYSLDDDTYTKHRLLETLSMLDILEYDKFYDGVWEIKIKVR